MSSSIQSREGSGKSSNVVDIIVELYDDDDHTASHRARGIQPDTSLSQEEVIPRCFDALMTVVDLLNFGMFL
jgi:hypothetical protein